NTHDMVSVLRLDGTIVYESPSCESILGYKPEERMGKSCFDFVHPDERQLTVAKFKDAMEKGDVSKTVEYRYLHKAGHYVTLEVTGKLSTDENGMPIVIVNKRDITERKAMEAELRKSDDLYRNVVETQNELICRFLPDSTLTFVNEAYCRFFGKSRDELVGNKFLELIPAGFRKNSEELLRKLMEDRVSAF